jgi:hypothetical protein
LANVCTIGSIVDIIFFFFFFFVCEMCLNSDLRTCKGGTLQVEPHRQPIFPGYFRDGVF